jgi:23S rRNA (cytidine1920-2'-O)/16S rRNA (cytidine1409-2'-O)-methyltransferase
MVQSRKRLDVMLVEQGLAESREQAKRSILAGAVTVDGQPATKPDNMVPAAASIAVLAPPRFVSRGGDKLEAAFAAFGIDVAGLDCMDVGASTGGFTDCLLQHGAARVAAVDVGRGLIHWRIRGDPRVTVIEGLNARYVKKTDIPFTPAFATVDVAFISLTTVLPAVIQVLSGDARLVTLIKPQFEAGRRDVGRGGVVRDQAVRGRVVERIRLFGTSQLGLVWNGVIESPVVGPAGNIEFLAYWRTGSQGSHTQ